MPEPDTLRRLAEDLDARDPLAAFREEFVFPRTPAGAPVVYLAGNSLGLMPRGAPRVIQEELDAWAGLGVGAHLEGTRPWYSYHEHFRGPLARLVGALPDEVVAMNSLTVNEHLMLVSFYRPTAERFRIVIEDNAFPSDSYAVQSHIALHNLDPARALVRLVPRPGEHCLRTEDVLDFLRREGQTVALVLLGAVNYATGQWFDMPAITRAAREVGAAVGWDLAHAIGNVPMRLHDWGCDFAVWCSYKYLNAGPGAVAGAFVHQRHADGHLPRLAGWWGNDPATRFEMRPDFVPRPGADGWQVSNPPILSMAPLLASFDLFDRAGMDRLREKSRRLTEFMLRLLDELCPSEVGVLTPRDPDQRGCQISLAVPGDARAVHARLIDAGIVCDVRPPNIIRAAPVPLYNSFTDVYAFGTTLARAVE